MMASSLSNKSGAGANFEDKMTMSEGRNASGQQISESRSHNKLSNSNRGLQPRAASFSTKQPPQPRRDSKVRFGPDEVFHVPKVSRQDRRSSLTKQDAGRCLTSCIRRGSGLLKPVDAKEPGKTRFGTVEVFKYALRPSENPSCVDGCAVELSDHVLATVSVSVDVFESLPKRSNPKRNKRAKKLSPEVREKLLLNQGYLIVQIREAAAAKDKLRQALQLEQSPPPGLGVLKITRAIGSSMRLSKQGSNNGVGGSSTTSSSMRLSKQGSNNSAGGSSTTTTVCSTSSGSSCFCSPHSTTCCRARKCNNKKQISAPLENHPGESRILIRRETKKTQVGAAA